ncbi:DinB [gamma proteobacterium IMCC1989]|nr:DinB [gamma proteobacterium IMCC1989]
MSLKKELLKFLNYKKWANNITFESLSSLPESELYKERETNFKTIVSTLNHVYVVDDIFKAHLTGVLHGYSARNVAVPLLLPELLHKQQVMDGWYVDFIVSLDESNLDNNITFEFVGGGEGNMSVSDIVFHLVNHGTYHRGFVSDMMYQIPAIPPANDLTVYLRDVYKNNIF